MCVRVVCKGLCMCVRVCVDVCKGLCMCVRVCVDVCKGLCMCACMYIYT